MTGCWIVPGAHDRVAAARLERLKRTSKAKTQFQKPLFFSFSRHQSLLYHPPCPHTQTHYPQLQTQSSSVLERVSAEQQIVLWSPTKKGELFVWSALLAIIFWVFPSLLQRSLWGSPPFTFVTLRFGIGGLLLLLVSSKDGRFLSAFTIKDWVSINLLAIVGIQGTHFFKPTVCFIPVPLIQDGIGCDHAYIHSLSRSSFPRGSDYSEEDDRDTHRLLGVFLVISKGMFSISIFRFGSTFGDFFILISASHLDRLHGWRQGFLSRFSPLAAITPIMIVGCLITLPFTWLNGNGISSSVYL